MAPATIPATGFVAAGATELPPPAQPPDAAEVRRGVSRDVVLTFGGRLALTAALIVGDVILARGLGPEGKGAFVLVLNLTSLGGLILSLGLERSLAVFAARSLSVARQAFINVVLWTLLVGGLGVVAIITLYGPPANGQAATGLLAPIMPDLTPRQLLIGALALPGEIAFSIGLVGLLGRQRVIAYNIMRFLRRGAFVVLLVSFVLLGRLNLELVLMLNLVALALTIGGILWAMARAGMVGYRPNGRMLLQQLSFGGRTVVGTLAERLHFRANTFLLNALVGVGATGVFSVALGLAEILWYLPTSFGLVLFSRAVRGGREGANIASAMTRVVFALMLIGAVPLWFIAPPLIEFVYGTPFAAAGSALQLMLPGVVAYSIVAVLTHPLIAWGAPGRVTVVLIAGLAVNLAANAMLIPELGMNGAAIASTISYTMTAVLTLILYRRLSGHGLRRTLIARPSDIGRIVSHLRGRLA